MVTDGDQAPEFELATDAGGSVKLRSLKGRTVVLYFYPKYDTSGCTKEAIAFTELAGAFAARDAEVIGVSPDSAASHDKYKAKHNLSVTLAADPEKEVANAYGVWVEKSMYGRKFMGVERSTFLIDRKAKVAKVWRKVRVPGHAEAVLAAVEALDNWCMPSPTAGHGCHPPRP